MTCPVASDKTDAAVELLCCSFSAESNLRSLFIYDRSSHIIQTCCLPKKKLFQSVSHFINLTGDESSRKSTSSVLITSRLRRKQQITDILFMSAPFNRLVRAGLI